MALTDFLGRRQVLIWGGILQAPWLFAIAILGTKDNPTSSDAKGLVACVLLFNFWFSGTWAPIAYVIGSEIGTSSLREKTMAFSSSINVVAAWLVAFTVPYLLDVIGANIGWVYGGFAVVATTYAYWFVPEIKNRSLEELDELFHNRVSARKFAQTETHGAAHRIRELESHRRAGSAVKYKDGAPHGEDAELDGIQENRRRSATPKHGEHEYREEV